MSLINEQWAPWATKWDALSEVTMSERNKPPLVSPDVKILNVYKSKIPQTPVFQTYEEATAGEA